MLQILGPLLIIFGVMFTITLNSDDYSLSNPGIWLSLLGLILTIIYIRRDSKRKFQDNFKENLIIISICWFITILFFITSTLQQDWGMAMVWLLLTVIPGFMALILTVIFVTRWLIKKKNV
jgi:hypothetical protein